MENIPSLFEILSNAKGDKVDIAAIYSHLITRKSNILRKPLTAQLELLPLCNFKCGFCYIRKTAEEVRNSGQHIMTFDEWKFYIDGCIRLGVSNITLSGGECTIHPDFLKIYKYAYDNGLMISLITNGSHITDEIFELFEKCPPSRISLTLYGMSTDTYERICGNGAYFDTVIRNIERMVKRGLTVTLNYTAGNDNFCDMEAVLEYARKKRIAIFPTDALFCSGKCGNTVLEKELVSHEEYKRIEREHYGKILNKSVEEMEESFFSTFSEPLRYEKKGMYCSAGRSAIFINWLGLMIPCVNFDVVKFDPREIGFEESWAKIVEWADNVTMLEECAECIFSNKCHRCVAIHYGDTGEFGKVSPRFCFKVLYPEAAAKMQAKHDKLKSQQKENTENVPTQQGESVVEGVFCDGDPL